MHHVYLYMKRLEATFDQWPNTHLCEQAIMTCNKIIVQAQMKLPSINTDSDCTVL